MLTRICQYLRGKINDDSMDSITSFNTNSSLRNTKRSTNSPSATSSKKSGQFSAKTKRLTEGDCI